MGETEYKDLFSKAFEEIELENNNLEFVNLLITGKSGVGKSTLINTVFGEELASTGIGKPVTDKINLIEKEGFPVHIYDTVGFELNKMGFDIGGIVKSIRGNDIQNLIKKVQSTETEEDDIHTVWYLISGTSARIEEAELAFIKWMIEHKLPVIIVLSKSYDKTESDKLKAEILKLVPDVKGVITVLAQKTDALEPFGIEELIQTTFKALPEGLQASFVHSQEASSSLKRNEAVKVVTFSMAKAFGTGFAAISDTKQTLAEQTEMMAQITSIYGIDADRQQIETAISSMVRIYETLIAGKNLTANFARLLPGLGTAGGGLISGSVGMMVTGVLGYAYIELMELVLQGKIDLSTKNAKELTELLLKLLPNYLPKQ